MIAPLLLALSAEWFPFTPANDYGASAIGMTGWLHPLTGWDAVREKGDTLSCTRMR